VAARIDVACTAGATGSCTGTVTLAVKPRRAVAATEAAKLVLIGKARFRAAAGGRVAVRIVLNRTGKGMLASARTLRGVVVTVRVQDEAGTVRAAKRTIVLRAPRALARPAA
jgi:hypothetical protein